ncbi:MAG: hypothetical protein ACOY15_13850 [Pseudomonadota bacterium]
MAKTGTIRSPITHAALLMFVLGMGSVEADSQSSWQEAQEKELKIFVTQSIEIAVEVAKEKFDGKGVGGGDLDYEHVSALQDKGKWIVHIPEARPHSRPHGLTLSVDPRTGKWSPVVVE